jgi:hypothetical protein
LQGDRAGSADPGGRRGRIDGMTHSAARRSAAPHLLALLLVLLALAGGLRAGLAAPVTAPLPLASVAPSLPEPVDTEGLAHATFAVG